MSEAKGHVSDRFLGRVADYAKARPGYPAELLGFLVEAGALFPGGRVVDIGSGTGLSTELFLSGGYEVTGDHIRHFVEVASLEVWTGTVQERWYKIDGDRLELLTQPLTVGSDAPVGRLVWTRVTRAAPAA